MKQVETVLKIPKSNKGNKRYKMNRVELRVLRNKVRFQYKQDNDQESKDWNFDDGSHGDKNFLNALELNVQKISLGVCTDVNIKFYLKGTPKEVAFLLQGGVIGFEMEQKQAESLLKTGVSGNWYFFFETRSTTLYALLSD